RHPRRRRRRRHRLGGRGRLTRQYRESQVTNRRAAHMGKNETAANVRMEPLEPRDLLSAGDLDLTFNKSGIVHGPNFSAAAALVVQPRDGKIVVNVETADPASPRELTLTRYNSDGSLDQ